MHSPYSHSANSAFLHTAYSFNMRTYRILCIGLLTYCSLAHHILCILTCCHYTTVPNFYISVRIHESWNTQKLPYLAPIQSLCNAAATALPSGMHCYISRSINCWQWMLKSNRIPVNIVIQLISTICNTESLEILIFVTKHKLWCIKTTFLITAFRHSNLNKHLYLCMHHMCIIIVIIQMGQLVLDCNHKIHSFWFYLPTVISMDPKSRCTWKQLTWCCLINFSSNTFL